ncbi:uncharacterized protein N7503_011862 [Penicillium pulvis]|uniref:uncharacterized protein n=1 Tax=Penicillium pulvis TaxID=1562058 RepID=UPI002547DECD|nr:uncharacterized protein N7503_011862 [Penicillium pulvis]KAJ5786650.1 hypothetical protein N7503_011862 [Penicillium pulvis]
MPPLSIRVSGQATITRHPERAVLRVSINASGGEKDSVSTEGSRLHDELNALFKELSPKTKYGTATTDAPVTEFSSTILHVWTQEPAIDERKPATCVNCATSTFQVTFRDFGKLDEIAKKLDAYPSVEVESIEWHLTESTEKALEYDARKQAMRNAILRAEDYAEVIGRKVVPVEVDDTIQAHQGQNRYLRPVAMEYRERERELYPGWTPKAGGGGIDPTPRDIRLISSQVSVKFEAVD